MSELGATEGSVFYRPPTYLSFRDQGGEVGKLEIKDGKLIFEGNADESAKIFFDHVIALWDQRAASATA